MIYSYLGGLMLEKYIDNIAKNLYRVRWSLNPENRIGVVGKVTENHMENGNVGLYTLSVVTNDPFALDGEYVVDELYATEKEMKINGYTEGRLVTWGWFFAQPNTIKSSDVDKLRNDGWRVDVLYQMYLEYCVNQGSVATDELSE